MLLGSFSYLGRDQVRRIRWRRIRNLVRSYGGGWKRRPRNIDSHLRLIMIISVRRMSGNEMLAQRDKISCTIAFSRCVKDCIDRQNDYLYVYNSAMIYMVICNLCLLNALELSHIICFSHLSFICSQTREISLLGNRTHERARCFKKTHIVFHYQFTHTELLHH
jgi:hypothetical protein